MNSKKEIILPHFDESVKYFVNNGEFYTESNGHISDGPLISVIITTYNRSDLLDRAIRSVQIQNYKNIEIIVIDDKSTDTETNEILLKWEKESKFPFSFFINTVNSGPSISRLNGVEKSKGDYLIFMDDDDYYVNVNAFQQGITAFENHEDLSFVAGDSLLEFGNSGQIKYQALNSHGYHAKEDFLINFQTDYDKPRSTFSTIFSKSKLEESGAFQMDMFNDSSIYMRALLTGGGVVVNDVWGVYYIHDNNISNTIDCKFIMENMKEKYEIYKLMMSRGYGDEEWIVRHFNLTIKYFFRGSNTKNIDSLVNWINGIDDKKIQSKIRYSLYKEQFKNKIRSIIKG